MKHERADSRSLSSRAAHQIFGRRRVLLNDQTLALHVSEVLTIGSGLLQVKVGAGLLKLTAVIR